MAVLINFKICDNAKECGGIEVCPTGALSWDEKNQTIKIDNSKCTSCHACEKACEVHAISVAENDEEYTRLKKEIDDDTRKISDLMIDKYGSQPVFLSNLIDKNEFKTQVLDYNKLVVAEFFNDDSVQCLLKSIPIKQLFDSVDIKYRKVKLSDDSLQEKYDIKNLPALVFFRNGKLLGKIEGYFTTKQLDEVKEKVNKIIT
jgi:NAD-dependent dihydropyrimidine dehydrogenase PreA subunit